MNPIVKIDSGYSPTRREAGLLRQAVENMPTMAGSFWMRFGADICLKVNYIKPLGAPLGRLTPTQQRKYNKLWEGTAHD